MRVERCGTHKTWKASYWIEELESRSNRMTTLGDEGSAKGEGHEQKGEKQNARVKGKGEVQEQG